MPLTLNGTTGIAGVDGSASNPALKGGTSTTAGVVYPAADTVAIATASTERLRVDSAGNLGLGVTPSAWSGYRTLQLGTDSFVGGSSSASLINLGTNCYYNGTSWIYSANGPASQYYQLNSAHIWRTSASGTAGNAISFTQAMTLDASGNLLVGTTTSAAKLTVVPASSGIAAAFGTGSGLNYISVGSGNATTYHTRFGYDVTNEYGYIQAYAASGVADDIMICPSGGELRVGGTTDQGAYNLQCNGTGVWGAGAYVNGSDERLKEQIQDIQPCLEVVRSLRPVTFKYKADYSKDRSIQPGFLAQELQAALGKQAYVDGIVSHGPTYLNVAYQSIIPVLTKAIQELSAKLDAAEARLAALEAK